MWGAGGVPLRKHWFCEDVGSPLLCAQRDEGPKPIVGLTPPIKAPDLVMGAPVGASCPKESVFSVSRDYPNNKFFNGLELT